MSSQAFERVTGGYYLAPDPVLAASALQHALGLLTAHPDRIESFFPLIYLFGRIARLSDEAHRAFVPIVAAYAGPHREPVHIIVSGARFPNALELVADSPQVLDLMWAEFFVTGARAPIEKIATALDLPDGVRRRFEQWLSGSRSRSDRAKIDELVAAGLVVDLDAKKIVTTGDLDCACFAIAERGIRIFPMLPFELTPEELGNLGAKSSAVWSLRLNGERHPIVVEACDAESRRAGGPARHLIAVRAAAASKPFQL